ncbi:hypothetical protein IFM89_013818 [Coptis chinensis]|uniref:Hexosyltransferase n=1 Tax=Coptis chinensis TaxID=261450 RepID=A0A835LVE7_9MAGN|nr:hypothetical protein IFM89_013818 [Coptis chinensis]
MVVVMKNFIINKGRVKGRRKCPQKVVWVIYFCLLISMFLWIFFQLKFLWKRHNIMTFLGWSMLKGITNYLQKQRSSLQRQSVKYYEPEYWKFGEEGNKYFRHATGPFEMVIVSIIVAAIFSFWRSNCGVVVCDCKPILHKYANEDVSLGAWFIGLEVEHIDERNMCCGTPPGKIFQKICYPSYKFIMVAFANQWKRSRKFMQDVVKVMELFGVPCSKLIR